MRRRVHLLLPLFMCFAIALASSIELLFFFFFAIRNSKNLSILTTHTIIIIYILNNFHVYHIGKYRFYNAMISWKEIIFTRAFIERRIEYKETHVAFRAYFYISIFDRIICVNFFFHVCLYSLLNQMLFLERWRGKHMITTSGSFGYEVNKE